MLRQPNSVIWTELPEGRRLGWQESRPDQRMDATHQQIGTRNHNRRVSIFFGTGDDRW